MHSRGVLDIPGSRSIPQSGERLPIKELPWANRGDHHSFAAAPERILENVGQLRISEWNKGLFGGVCGGRV